MGHRGAGRMEILVQVVRGCEVAPPAQPHDRDFPLNKTPTHPNALQGSKVG
jgi:hypothetical protein